MIHDARRCELGEGALWHPMRRQLFWFDILGQKLLSSGADGPLEWQFDHMVSAAGWIGDGALMIAGEAGLFLFDLDTGARLDLCALESDDPKTRSNDGRADPYGGFWIGTMGKSAQPGAGAIYRYYQGQIRRLYGGLTIPNAICFAPDGQSACFTDTALGQVMRVGLDDHGWPVGAPQVYLDLHAQGLNPDGAVIDAAGVIWIAQWGAGRVAAYDPMGSFLRAVEFAAPHTSCPAFGGADGRTLYCTSALQGMDAAARAAWPAAGGVFAAHDIAKGQSEHQVII